MATTLFISALHANPQVETLIARFVYMMLISSWSPDYSDYPWNCGRYPTPNCGSLTPGIAAVDFVSGLKPFYLLYW